MRSFLATLAATLVCLASVPAGADATRGSEDEAVAMVKRAIHHYDQHGRDKALADLSRDPGPFVDRDLYVTVYDFKGTALAHINQKMLGRNLINLRDPDGKYIVRERTEAALKQATGWQEYKFYNPSTKRIEPKHMYWERHDNLIFGCGAYQAR